MKESNIEKARRLYPIGTEYIPLHKDGSSFKNFQTEIADIEPDEYSSGNIEANNTGYIYIKECDVWAIIVNAVKTDLEGIRNNL